MNKQDHTVKSFDQDLNSLRAIITEMVGICESQIDGSVAALIALDGEAASKIITADKRLDELERKADQMTIEIFARRSPFADDLRELVAILKIANILERVGDYAKNIAKRTVNMTDESHIISSSTIKAMANYVSNMLADVTDAYLNNDADKARAVWEFDVHVDELNNTMFRELLTHMMENPATISTCTHLIFISKNIERMGDHITNIAELIYFQVTGEPLDYKRPKGKTTFELDPPKDD